MPHASDILHLLTHPSPYRSVVCLLLASILLPAAARTQTEPRFEAGANAREVLLNSTFDLTFTLYNGEGRNFQPPGFRDVQVMAGPSSLVSGGMINGQKQLEMRIIYTLKPLRTGRLTIGRATIDVDGRTLRSNPVAVEVLAAAKTARTGGGEAFFVRAEPATLDGYIGQQILLEYKLYTTTLNIDNYNILQESDYPGFYAEDLRRLDGRVMREVVDGREYVTKVLKRVALFPQQAGVLTVGPMQLQLGIVEEDDRPGGFFFNRQIRRLPAATEPVQISVRPLPDDPPPAFTGAVGRFSMTSSAARTTLTTDDVISLRLTISGDGDIKRVLPPTIRFPDTFDVYDPRTVEETIIEEQGRLVGRKTFEYLALPRAPGEYEVQPALTYFDPDSTGFVTLADSRYAITVRPGSRPAEGPAVTDDTPPAPADIRFIKATRRLFRADHRFLGSPLFWGLAAAPFALLGGLLLVRRAQRRRAQEDPGERRRRRARHIAQQRLQRADQHRRQGQHRDFYDEVSKAMLGYVGDKLQIARSAMSKDNVRDKLQTLQVPAPEIERFLTVMQTCEMALFAGRDDAGAVDATYQQALDVLATLEQRLKA